MDHVCEEHSSWLRELYLKIQSFVSQQKNEDKLDVSKNVCSLMSVSRVPLCMCR